MEKEVLLTKEGLKKLEDELNELKTTKRREVAEKIKIARGFGDLSENAEYDEAKLEQAQNEDRVLKIEEMLRNATVIEEDDAKGDIVKIGSKVRLFWQRVWWRSFLYNCWINWSKSNEGTYIKCFTSR